MKRLFILLSVIVCFSSCYKDEDFRELQRNCRELSATKFNLQRDIDALKGRKGALNREIEDMRAEKGILRNGREPQYIIKIKIKQGTFTLDPFEHIKNEANATEMEIPVSRGFYNSVNVGTDLTDSFKAGSFWIDGDLSWLHLTIIDKRIK
jgi:hypothetical protein